MQYKHFTSNLKKENEYPKLVRDRIPEIIKEDIGREPKTRILGNEEYLEYLLAKVEEEANELANARGMEHQIEEMADVLELIDALLEFYDFDWEAVRKVQKEKAEKRGGFKKRILMLGKA